MSGLKQEILSAIVPVEQKEEWFLLSGEITRAAIQNALEAHESVEIPDTGKPILLDEPIILRSNHHLKVAKNQVITQCEGNYACLVRNEHIQSGAEHMPDGVRDRNISVRGGVWKTSDQVRAGVDRENSVQGALGNIIFCCVEQSAVLDLTIWDSVSYGIQLSDCKDFTVERIHFLEQHKDGVHVNGPANYGVIRQLTGENMGDDMVALNAWDWYTSAITFGTIDHVVVEDVKSNNNELRLLPGQKLFKNGEKVDCDIRSCVLEHISGIYTFKLYAQPNIANAIRGIHDVSGTVGVIEDVHLKDISFLRVTSEGLNGLPVKSMVEVCADVKGLYLEDISVDNTLEECRALDVCLMNVGPLSAVWKNGSEDPEKWGEVFDPDAICTADDLHFKNIRFAGEQVTDPTALTREVHMKVNADYPNTTPRGGTGYGVIKSITIE